jgi:hypothetical protein
LARASFLEARIRRLAAPSILAWFQDISRGLHPLALADIAAEDFWGTVHGFGSPFEAKKDLLHTEDHGGSRQAPP